MGMYDMHHLLSNSRYNGWLCVLCAAIVPLRPILIKLP